MPEAQRIPGLLKDCLRVFNFKRAQELILMTDDQLWAFVDKNRRFLNRLFKGKRHPNTGALFGYLHSEMRFHEFFFQELEEYREYVINMLIHDFCLGHQKIILGYWGKSGYLDNPDSCSTILSKDFLPEYGNEDYFYREELYFHLLEINQVDNIIYSLKANIGNLQINTPIDISRIEKIRNFCSKHEGFKIAYVYDL
jgi:hypothetical protein